MIGIRFSHDLPTHPQRLYLVMLPLGDTASFLRDLGPVLEAGDIPALLLRLEPADERTLINRAKSVAAVVQRSGSSSK